MAEKNVIVFAWARPMEGREEIVKHELLSLLPQFRSEHACTSCSLYQSMEDRPVFMVYQVWTTREDLDAFVKTPSVKDLVRKIDHLLEEPLAFVPWEPVGGL